MARNDKCFATKFILPLERWNFHIFMIWSMKYSTGLCIVHGCGAFGRKKFLRKRRKLPRKTHFDAKICHFLPQINNFFSKCIWMIKHLKKINLKNIYHAKFYRILWKSIDFHRVYENPLTARKFHWFHRNPWISMEFF